MTSFTCKACGKEFDPEELRGGCCPYCGAPVSADGQTDRVTDPEKQAEIYEKALSYCAKAASFGEWDTAAKLFASVSGYKDAQERAAQCRGKAEEARCEAVYLLALRRQGGTVEALRGKAELLRTLPGYKDSEELADQYERQAAEMEADLIAARREQQEKRQQESAAVRERSGKRRKAILIAAAVGAVILAAVLVVSLWIIPKGQYDLGLARFNAGDYPGAREIFENIPHYGDAADYLGRINGHMGIEAAGRGEYREALVFFEQTGGREEFKGPMEEVLDILNRQAMDDFYRGDFASAQKKFDDVDKYPGYEIARAYKQLCRAIRLWNREEGVNAEKLDMKEALPAVKRIADGTWYCEATGNEISPSGIKAEENRLVWQEYTLEFRSASALSLTGDGGLAGEYEKE